MTSVIANSKVSGEQLGTQSRKAKGGTAKLRKSKSKSNSMMRSLGNVLHTKFCNKADAKQLSAGGNIKCNNSQQKGQPLGPADHKVLQKQQEAKINAAQNNEAKSKKKKAGGQDRSRQ
jgi:hypothetical protein